MTQPKKPIVLLVRAEGRIGLLHYPELRLEILDPREKIPHRDYIDITRRGLYRVRHVGLQRSCLSEPDVQSLPEPRPYADLDLPALPAHLLLEALDFHRRIYRAKQSESILLINFDVAARRYSNQCPQQWVPVGSARSDAVEYAIEPTSAVTQVRVGTVHSHIGIGPRPSALDLADTRGRFPGPGIHAIWGWAETSKPVLDLYIVVSGRAFQADPSRWVSGALPRQIRKSMLPSSPLDWLHRVHDQPEQGSVPDHPGFNGGAKDAHS